MNTSYLFIPFKTPLDVDFRDTIAALKASPRWALKHDDIQYMFKYVSDKFNSYDDENCQCFHFELSDSTRSEMSMGENSVLYATKPHSYNGKDKEIVFRVLDVQLFCFGTGVHFVAFRLEFSDDDPLWIANAAYYLKKSSREAFHRVDNLSSNTTFLGIAEKLVSELDDLSFFFYSNKGTERSNMMIFADHSAVNDLKKELYYLKYCYNDNFPDASANNGDNDFPLFDDRHWGISQEALVCVINPTSDSDYFLRGRFFENFNTQYLFLYVLLLHRRAVLYKFLTEIGANKSNNIKRLQEYKERLYEYENNFEFTRITEVPQHQGLYNKILETFALDDMLHDVREPLLSLSALQERENEAKRQKGEAKLNFVLLMLSLLSIFSACVDSYDFFGEISEISSHPPIIMALQLLSLVGIVGLVLYAVLTFFKQDKEK